MTSREQDHDAELAGLRDQLEATQRRLLKREAECRELTESVEFAETSARVWRRRAERFFVENERLLMEVAALKCLLPPEDSHG